MFELDREALAYLIMALVAAVLIPWLLMRAKRRRREKLRRRGVKTHGH